MKWLIKQNKGVSYKRGGGLRCFDTQTLRNKNNNHAKFFTMYVSMCYQLQGANQDPRRIYRRSIVQHFASQHLTPKVKRSVGTDNVLIRTKRRHVGAHEQLTPKSKRSYDSIAVLTRTKRLDVAANDESQKPITMKKRRDIPRNTRLTSTEGRS